MYKLVFLALLFSVLATGPTAYAAPAVTVDTCGQIVTGVGTLAADLDCSGFASGESVTLRKGARLELNGHTLTGNSGQVVVLCCKEIEPAPACKLAKCSVFGPGVITGGLGGIRSDRADVRDLTIDVAAGDGVSAIDRAKIRNSTITGSAFAGVDSQRIQVRESSISGHTTGLRATVSIKVSDSDITGNSGSGVSLQGANTAKRVVLKDSMVSQNGDFGILATTRATVRRSEITDNGGVGIQGTKLKLKDSTVTGNAESGLINTGLGSFPTKLKGCNFANNCLLPADPTSCADLRVCTAAMPRLKATTCETSINCASPPATWGVCAFD